MHREIITERLRLVNCSRPTLEVVFQGNAALAAHLGVVVPDDWTECGPPVFEYLRTKLDECPEDEGWWTWLAILRSENMLLGCCGYKGRPCAEGVVEFGYEIAARRRQLGLGTECAIALRDFAFTFPEVQTVSAHTLAEQNASTRILERCGLRKVAELVDPEDGPIWRWELHRREHETEYIK